VKLKVKKSTKSKKGKGKKNKKKAGGVLTISGPTFVLMVECEDASGNPGSISATAVFPEKVKKAKKTKTKKAKKGKRAKRRKK
jgi:hypothetical protein